MEKSSKKITKYFPIFIICSLLFMVACKKTEDDPALINLPLKIVSFSPKNNERNVGLGEEIHIFFNKPLDPATINKENIKLVPDIAGRMGYLRRKNMVKFVPTIGRIPDFPYSVTVTKGLKDKWGKSLSRPTQWVFRTRFR